MKLRHFILGSFFAWAMATEALAEGSLAETNLFKKLQTSLDHIFQGALPADARRSFGRLQFFSVLNAKQSRHAHAYYLESKSAIAVNPSLAKRGNAEVLSILAHELGHVLVFSRLSPQDLQLVAADVGGWQFQSSPRSHYDTPLLTKFSGQVTDNKAFPSLYAFANTHEWFAENFAQFVMNRLGENKKINQKLNRYFESLVSCQDKAASALPCLDESSLVNNPSPTKNLGLVESHYALNSTFKL